MNGLLPGKSILSLEAEGAQLCRPSAPLHQGWGVYE